PHTGGRSETEAAGSTLDEVLGDPDGRFPGLRFRIVDEHDRVRPHINFFVGTKLVRDLAVPVAPDDRADDRLRAERRRILSHVRDRKARARPMTGGWSAAVLA